MKEKDNIGRKFEECKEYKTYVEKVKKFGFNIDYLFFSRHTCFIPDGSPPCDICGGTKLIHGVGRYVSFDEERTDNLAIFLCGYCVTHLEEIWEIEMDMV